MSESASESETNKGVTYAKTGCSMRLVFFMRPAAHKTPVSLIQQNARGDGYVQAVDFSAGRNGYDRIALFCKKRRNAFSFTPHDDDRSPCEIDGTERLSAGICAVYPKAGLFQSLNRAHRIRYDAHGNPPRGFPHSVRRSREPTRRLPRLSGQSLRCVLCHLHF